MTIAKNLFRLYALAVCFVSVLVFSIALGTGVYDVIQINLPETTMSSWHYERHQSNENFTRDWPPKKAVPDDDELTRMREQSYLAAIELETRDAHQSLIVVAIIILITVTLFAVHWRLSRATRSE